MWILYYCISLWVCLWSILLALQVKLQKLLTTTSKENYKNHLTFSEQYIIFISYLFIDSQISVGGILDSICI